MFHDSFFEDHREVCFIAATPVSLVQETSLCLLTCLNSLSQLHQQHNINKNKLNFVNLLVSNLITCKAVFIMGSPKAGWRLGNSLAGFWEFMHFHKSSSSFDRFHPISHQLLFLFQKSVCKPCLIFKRKCLQISSLKQISIVIGPQKIWKHIWNTVSKCEWIIIYYIIYYIYYYILYYNYILLNITYINFKHDWMLELHSNIYLSFSSIVSHL